jgi:hypothetical protein
MNNVVGGFAVALNHNGGAFMAGMCSTAYGLVGYGYLASNVARNYACP